MKKGTVNFFNESKGFEFITEESSKTDYFMRIFGLIDKVIESDVVEFELKEGEKGLKALFFFYIRIVAKPQFLNYEVARYSYCKPFNGHSKQLKTWQSHYN